MLATPPKTGIICSALSKNPGFWTCRCRLWLSSSCCLKLSTVFSMPSFDFCIYASRWLSIWFSCMKFRRCFSTSFILAFTMFSIRCRWTAASASICSRSLFFLAPVLPAAFPSNYQTGKSSGQTAIGESWWKIIWHLLLFTSVLKSSNFSVTQNEFLIKILYNLSQKTLNGIYSW